MDGLNFRVGEDILSKYFSVDKYGSYIPDRNKLHMEEVKSRFSRQLAGKYGLYRRLAEIYERTDVQFTDNPLGNTPVLGVGFKLFGQRPLLVRQGERDDRLRGRGQNLDKKLGKRERKIEAVQQELMALRDSLKPTDEESGDYLLWLVEGDQVKTGGGFDNNAVGEVHKSALNFVVDSSAKIDYENTVLSQVVVEGSIWIKELIHSYGIEYGSIKPQGASVVRAEQDSDGMLGYPVYSKGNDALTQDLAKRLLIESGVDTSRFVGTDVVDATTGVKYKYRVIDAAGYILDNKIFTANDMVSLVTLLARIQKHGWKEDNGKLVSKPGKTRSVYPNAFIPAIIEAMIMSPFNDKLKEVKASIMPSLQDKPTRVEMIRKQISDAIANGYDYLANRR